MRKLSYLLAAAMLAAALTAAAGCAQRTPGGYEPADPDRKAEITYYIWGEKEQNEALAQKFHQIYPNWTVKVELATGDYYNNLQTYFGAGTAPDLFYMESGQIMPFLKEGQLLNLTPYLEKGEDFTEEDLWQVNDGYRYDPEARAMGSGDLYAMIKDLTPDFMMIYNKSHIDEYNRGKAESEKLHKIVGYPVDEGGEYPSAETPMSWEQCQKLCRLLTKFNEKGDITRYGTVLDQVPWKHMMQWVQMQGGSMYANDDSNFNASSPEVVKAATYLRDFQVGDLRSAAPIASGAVAGGSGFKNGQISVVWNGRWAFQSYDWYSADFEIGVAPPPMPESGMESYNATNMIAHSISAASENPGVAYKFLEFLMTVGQKEFARTGYNVPGNRTIAYKEYLEVEDAEVLGLNRYFLSFVEKSQTIVYNRYLDAKTVEDILGLELVKCWDANASTRKSVEDALAACAVEIDKKIDQIKSRE